MCLDNGDRLIGIQYPDILMTLAEKEAKSLAAEKQVNYYSYTAPCFNPRYPAGCAHTVVRLSSILYNVIKLFSTSSLAVLKADACTLM